MNIFIMLCLGIILVIGAIISFKKSYVYGQEREIEENREELEDGSLLNPSESFKRQIQLNNTAYIFGYISREEYNACLENIDQRICAYLEPKVEYLEKTDWEECINDRNGK